MIDFSVFPLKDLAIPIQNELNEQIEGSGTRTEFTNLVQVTTPCLVGRSVSFNQLTWIKEPKRDLYLAPPLSRF